MLVDGAEQSDSMVGKFSIPGRMLVPDNNTFSMEVVNVKSPVLENVFYPWMRETTLPYWSYEEEPFTTATVTIDFQPHSDTVYKFYGCRPQQIQLIQPDQSPSFNLTRNVTFAFDFMTITSNGVKESGDPGKGFSGKMSKGKKNGDSLTNLANGALFSAANTLRL